MGTPTGQASPRQMPSTTSAPVPAPRPGAIGRTSDGDIRTAQQRANEQAQSPVALDGSEGVPGHNGVPGQPRPSLVQTERDAGGFALPRPASRPAGPPSLSLPDPSARPVPARALRSERAR